METKETESLSNSANTYEQKLAKINLIFAYIFMLMPAISLVFSLVVKNIKMLTVYLFIMVFYSAFLLMKFILEVINRKKFKITFNFQTIVLMISFVWLTINTIINMYSIVDTLFVYGYFLLIYNFVTIDSKHTEKIITFFIIQVFVSVILGLIDPFGKVFTIFGNNEPLGLQFHHFNYAGYVVALVMVLTLEKIVKETDIKKVIFWFVVFFTIGTYMLLQGSFVPITVMFVSILTLMIIEWVRNKKTPWKIIISFVILIPMIFVVDFWPNVENIRVGSSYNYFLEAIDVVDRLLGTDMLPKLTGAMGDVVESIPGADGWERNDLWAGSINTIFESFHHAVLGQGSGTYVVYRPHNLALGFLIEYGIVGFALFVLMLVAIVKAFIKSKNKWGSYFKFSSIVAMLLCYTFGAQVPYSFMFFIMFAVMFYNLFKNEGKEKTH